MKLLCADAETGCGGPQRLRAERLREGFWLGVAARAAVRGVFRLAAQNLRAVVLACPLGRPCALGGASCVSLLSGGDGPLPALPEGGAVILAIDVALLRHILGADFDSLPPAALAVATGAADGAREVRVVRSAEHLLAACALRDCSHCGAVRNVYLKSKALELFALSFGALKWQERPNPADLMPPREVERMIRAREALLARHENPPSLGELAALVGVCETRLKMGFRNIFGDTPFGLLRRHRMAMAREMLVRDGARVSEAAAAVGYTNVSHFIDAFVRCYGVRPGELVRNGRGSAAAAE
ncbi:MAG: helix-turn-helix domain-containing protein [Rhodospirillaceae bacterium]